MEGEIRTRGAVDGRPITTDPIMKRKPLPLPVRRLENSLSCGLRVGWISGVDDNPAGRVRDFTVTTGAGVGSPWLILTITLRDGSTITEAVDMNDVVPKWVRAALAAGPSPDVTP
jgi:hypothetical protein